jgi:hypothetical protein
MRIAPASIFAVPWAAAAPVHLRSKSDLSVVIPSFIFHSNVIGSAALSMTGSDKHNRLQRTYTPTVAGFIK